MSDYQARLNNVQALMDRNNIDLLVLGASPDYQWLTGTHVEWRRGRDLNHPADSVFVPRDGEPIILASPGAAGKARESWITNIYELPRGEEMKPAVNMILQELESPNRVAVGEYTWSSLALLLARSLKGAKFLNGEGLLDRLRMIKDSDEVAKLRKAAELTDKVMEKAISQVEEGDLSWSTSIKIESIGRLLGASDVSFSPAAGFCKSGSTPTDQVFNYPRDKGLEPGTSIAFDIGFVLDGYCSDWGRSMYFGEPELHIREAYPTLQAAIVETMDAMGGEVQRLNEIFPSIEKVCDREGYGRYLRERLPDGTVGHQIGVEVHEDPWLKPANSDLLMDGMVFCMEPKLWHKGEYYLRVEDMVLIKNGVAESLTRYDREQFEL